MSTLTTTIKLASSDLSTNTLSLTTTAIQSPTSSSGLSRAKISATSKVASISINDGDGAVADVTTREGKFLDITDNHGLRKRYVFTTSDGSGVATGVIIANDTDTGGTSTPDSSVVGGTAVQIDNGDTENGILAKLVIAINHANGHNGSITASAPPTAANGVQAAILTNPAAGEGGSFIIDNANATWQDLNAATKSQANHTTILSPNTYASASFMFVKNTATNAAHTVTIYNAAFLGQDDIMTLAGGQSAFLPVNVADNLKAYTSNSGTILEFMHVGVE